MNKKILNTKFLLHKYINRAKKIYDKNIYYQGITLFHIIIGIFNFLFPIYSFIFNYNGIFNYIYLFFLILLYLHWIILRDECILTLILKKNINKNYSMGMFPIGIIDMYFNIITQTWTKPTTIYINNEKFYYNFIAFLAITYKLDINIFQKILYVFIFMIIFIKSLRIHNNVINYFNNNVKSRTNSIFKF